MLVKVKEQAHLISQKYKARIICVANRKVKARDFLEGSLILWIVKRPYRMLEDGKLATIWECPFKVKQYLGNGAYKL